MEIKSQNRNYKLLMKIERILESKRMKMLDNYLTYEEKKLLSQIENLKSKSVTKFTDKKIKNYVNRIEVTKNENLYANNG